ncbi:MAG: RNA polymerase subunit sigma [Planctomycetes bacterium]|nr:RNA polymerase subunit sigma [Planctomycetota bacterium]
MTNDPDAGDCPPAQALAGLSSAQLLPLVYDELRQLAAGRLANEGRSHQPMQPTSLVHAAYLRLIGDTAHEQQAWSSRAHFFGAAALAMRRILVERARQRQQLRRGGQWQRVQGTAGEDFPDLVDGKAGEDPVDMMALDTALSALEAESPDLYKVVMLRYFAGLSVDDAAATLDSSPRTVKRRWSLARLWLLDRMNGSADRAPP